MHSSLNTLFNIIQDQKINRFLPFSPHQDYEFLHPCDPSLCQLLFESQSPQLVSTVFSGRSVQPYYDKMTSPLDWFATGYCIAHSDTTSSWSVGFRDTLQCLQAFSSGLHYTSKLPGHLKQCLPLKGLYLRGPLNDYVDQ